jgi:hypothetical protein
MVNYGVWVQPACLLYLLLTIFFTIWLWTKTITFNLIRSDGIIAFNDPSPYNWFVEYFLNLWWWTAMIRRNGQGSVLLHLVGFTFPFFTWYASSNWGRFQYLVVPLPPCGLPLLGCMLAWTFLSQVSFSLPCLSAFFLFFLALFWVLSFYKVWQGFITIGISGLYIVFKCLNLWNIFYLW